MFKGLAIIAILLVSTNSAEVQNVCQIDRNCESGYSFIHKYLSSQTISCAPEKCEATLDITITIFECYEDTFFNPCASSYCFESQDVSPCFTKQPCLSETQEVMKCSQCVDSNCGTSKCLTFMGTETCSSQSSCEFDSAVYRTYSCKDNKDSLGRECRCCTSTSQPPTSKKMRQCLDLLPFETKKIDQLLKGKSLRFKNEQNDEIEKQQQHIDEQTQEDHSNLFNETIFEESEQLWSAKPQYLTLLIIMIVYTI